MKFTNWQEHSQFTWVLLSHIMSCWWFYDTVDDLAWCQGEGVLGSLPPGLMGAEPQERRHVRCLWWLYFLTCWSEVFTDLYYLRFEFFDISFFFLNLYYLLLKVSKLVFFPCLFWSWQITMQTGSREHWLCFGSWRKRFKTNSQTTCRVSQQTGVWTFCFSFPDNVSAGENVCKDQSKRSWQRETLWQSHPCDAWLVL